MPSEIENLNMDRIKSSIQWHGQVRLLINGERDDCLVGEYEWPKKSGKVYFACATSGLLFDKQSGRCLQSPNVVLLLDTMMPAAPSAMRSYLASRRQRGYGKNITVGSKSRRQ